MTIRRRRILRRTAEPLVLAVVGVALAALLSGASVSQLEYRFTDLRFAVLRALRTQREPPIAVLLVTRETEQRVGRPYDSSWRAEYPALVETLTRSGARALVFDAVFASEQPALDGPLQQAFSGSLPVVAGVTGDTAPAATLAGTAWQLGSLEVLAVDGVPRRARGVVTASTAGTDSPRFYPPISYLAASLTSIRPTTAQTAYADGFVIDYGYSLDQIPTFDLADVLFASRDRLADTRRTPLSVFSGRVVLLGTDLPGADRYPIPGSGGERRPGVLSQAAATVTAAYQTQIIRLPKGAAVTVAAAFAMLAGAAAVINRRRFRRIAYSVVLAAAVLVPVILFVAAGVEVHYVAALTATAAPLAVAALVRRLRVSRRYATSLGFDPELLATTAGDEPIERTACVLCADVREFTQFVTDNDPTDVHRVMDEYLRVMEQVVDEHGGYINKFVGDEIIAIVGFPRSEDAMVDRGLRIALAMLDQLTLLQAQWHLANLPALEAVGIGVDYGTLRFSHFGGKKRVQFDVLGNAINGASRLQVVSKEHGSPLVVPDSIAECQSVIPLQDQEDPGDLNLAFIGEVMIRGQGRRRVYGMSQPVR